MGASSDRSAYRIARADRAFAATAADLLRDLPEWFGRADARDDYAAATARWPTFVAYAADDTAAGFATIKPHAASSAEIYVIAVARAHHRKGCGSALVAQVEQALRADGIRWLTVKTLAASHPDPHYAATRRFYERVGFAPLEVFPTLWDADTPCLQMIKAID